MKCCDNSRPLSCLYKRNCKTVAIRIITVLAISIVLSAAVPPLYASADSTGGGTASGSTSTGTGGSGTDNSGPIGLIQTNPDMIRVGLYYNSSSVSSFSAGAASGLQLGILNNNIFTPLWGDQATTQVMTQAATQVMTQAATQVTVRKDAWFIRNGDGTLKEIASGDAAKQTVPVTGPIHISTGISFADYNAAMQMVSSLKLKNIAAYPAYADGWQVWAGYYASQESAQADIPNLQTALKTVQSANSTGNCCIVPADASRVTIQNQAGDTIFIFASACSFLAIHPMSPADPGSTGSAADNTVLKINSKNYRGDIEVRRNKDADMTVINVLPMEQYLYGVVPSEMESYAPAEALKAQAVAARTYAYCQLGKDTLAKWGFDIYPTTVDQVYKGFDGEAPQARSAVDSTCGKKLTYQGKLAQVFYFASDGGRTEDSENVFNEDIPYLTSVEDKYESGKSPNYTWTETIPASDIKKWMDAKNYNLGSILGVEITGYTPSGRTLELTVRCVNGVKVYTKGACRNALGLRSQWYSISTDSDVSVCAGDGKTVKIQPGGRNVMTSSGIKTLNPAGGTVSVLGAGGAKVSVPLIPVNYTFNGRGYGHAVGMSQEGAKGMAAAGFTYDRILEYYFPGTKVS